MHDFFSNSEKTTLRHAEAKITPERPCSTDHFGNILYSYDFKL